RMGQRNAFQELDQLGTVNGVVKWAAIPPEAAQLHFYLQRAFAEATSGRPGPVHLSVPFDFFSAEIPAAAPALPDLAAVPRPAPEAAGVEKLPKLLAKAERPVAIAGSGVWWSDAASELQTFIEKAGVPLYTVCLGRGAVSDEHSLCFGY